MKPSSPDRPLAEELEAILSTAFPGIQVETARTSQWKRPCVTFRWSGFTDLLPEERFHRLTQFIPASIREGKLAGYVWIELADDEGLEQFLKLPRSEDVLPRAPRILAGLKQAGAFDALAGSLGRTPDKKCTGDFQRLESVLSEKEYTRSKIQDVKLLMIARHAYCDCQALAAGLQDSAPQTDDRASAATSQKQK